jgi:phytoene synthase
MHSTGGQSAPGEDAAAAARDVLVKSKSSFGAAFVFLDKARREALDAVYAYCRLVDDAVDEAPGADAARAGLEEWRRRLDRVFAGAPSGEPGAAGDVERALGRAIARFPIRREDLAAVIDGCFWDLERPRYRNWDELRGYCERVASAVGLACIEIFGYREPGAKSYAVDLGLALQITNILRDVDEDAARGRIYLPLDEMADFGVTEAELLSGRRTTGRIRLLHFEAQRARLHFARARAAISAAEKRQLVAAEIMGDIYEKLLDELVARDFPSKRVRISGARKAAIALRRFALSRLVPSA